MLTLVLTFVFSGVARADDQAFLQILARELPTSLAAAAGAIGPAPDPEAVQRSYNAARDLEEALHDAEPVSRNCQQGMRAALALARGQVTAAEGFDRLEPGRKAAGEQAARFAGNALRGARPSCRPAAVAAPDELAPITAPGPGEAFFGEVKMAVPVGTTAARLLVDGRPFAVRRPDGDRVVFQVGVAPGRHTLELRFLAGERPLARARSEHVWLLPAPTAQAESPRQGDATLSAQLARAVSRFGGIGAAYVHDLATGRVGQANADARFPAASTVKLGLLIAALERFGARSRYSYDLAKVGAWSSNLGANRLLSALGNGSDSRGAAIAQASLRRAGASRSTFTGPYRAGTAAGEPPPVSARVTTARDLGRVLWTIQAGALGDAAAIDRLRLDEGRTRLLLGYLLASEPRGENAGLIRPFLPSSVSAARKEGWISDARLSAAIVYDRSGPHVVVCLAYAPELSVSSAHVLSRAVLRAAGLR